ncbi:MAG: hypothetical protein ACYDCL_15020 [Myxococcales bacterium]
MRRSAIVALALLLQGCVTASWTARCSSGPFSAGEAGGLCRCDAFTDGSVECFPTDERPGPTLDQVDADLGVAQWRVQADRSQDPGSADGAAVGEPGANPRRRVVTPREALAWRMAHGDP